MKEKMTSLLNRKAIYSVNGLSFRVVIKDVREVWGRTDCLIEPEAGTGQKWVSEAGLKLN